jgi:hypothetical protein
MKSQVTKHQQRQLLLNDLLSVHGYQFKNPRATLPACLSHSIESRCCIGHRLRSVNLSVLCPLTPCRPLGISSDSGNVRRHRGIAELETRAMARHQHQASLLACPELRSLRMRSRESSRAALPKRIPTGLVSHPSRLTRRLFLSLHFVCLPARQGDVMSSKH